MDDMTKDIKQAINGLEQGKRVRVWIHADMVRVEKIDTNKGDFLLHLRERRKQWTVKFSEMASDTAFLIYQEVQ